MTGVQHGCETFRDMQGTVEKRTVFALRLPASDLLTFCILACGAMVSSVSFAVLQEGVFRTPHFKLPALMTTVTTLSYSVCGAWELKKSRIRRKGHIRDYMLLACFSYGGLALTNHATSYLNYTTRIVFKSAKLLPVMVFSVSMVGRRYNLMQWLCAVLLVFGVFEFTIGDAAIHPNYAPKGILLMLGAVCLDALSSNFEERQFFRREDPCVTEEVLCFSSLFGTLYSLLYLRMRGELGLAASYCILYPFVVCKIVLFSILGYFSVTFILAIIKYFGAPEAEFVKSTRKVLSILLSFVLYPKKMNQNYYIGICAVIVAAVLQVGREGWRDTLSWCSKFFAS